MADPVLAAQQLVAEYDKDYGVGEIPPVPVADIAESLLMLDILEEDEIRSVPGAPTDAGPLSGLLTTANRTIWIDRREAARSPERKRFTIAHEIGHWIMHARRGEVPLFQKACAPDDIREDGASANPEREANDFANELVMPEELISALGPECGFNLALLAARFEVSVRALEIRLIRLDLLPSWMRA
ncbi:MAG: ImmA/IrrE family metallo-endopeptidase [Thermoleophilaceae bacterium]|nr:ImmA/IrrE family metallo-endopeptidase [Thermoleophilaceae bacterium]